jgi:hypothetical protein
MANNLVKFVNAPTKASFLPEINNHFYDVVFIEDTKEIYTHGIYYGVSPSDLTSLQNLITAAQTSADSKVSNVTGSNAIEVTSSGDSVTGDISKAVTLKINTGSTKGNVIISQDSDGLKASVDLSGVENLVEGVATNDKILSLSSKKIGSTLEIDYDSTSSKLQLKGIGDAVISELDATTFSATPTQGSYADSALQSIAKGTDSDYISLTVSSKSGNDGAKTQTVSVGATMQAISTASSQNQGLVEASDVKDYIDNKKYNKIQDSESSPHTSVETTTTSIEAYGSLHAGRYGLADSNGVNAFQVGNGIDSQNLSNIHELTWNGTSWTKQDVTCGGTAANPTKLLSRSMQMGADPMTESQLQTLINNSGLIPGCYYATIEE